VGVGENINGYVIMVEEHFEPFTQDEYFVEQISQVNSLMQLCIILDNIYIASILCINGM